MGVHAHPCTFNLSIPSTRVTVRRPSTPYPARIGRYSYLYSPTSPLSPFLWYRCRLASPGRRHGSPGVMTPPAITDSVMTGQFNVIHQQQLKCQTLARTSSTVRQGKRYGPSITVQIIPGLATLFQLSRAERRVGPSLYGFWHLCSGPPRPVGQESW